MNFQKWRWLYNILFIVLILLLGKRFLRGIDFSALMRLTPFTIGVLLVLYPVLYGIQLLSYRLIFLDMGRRVSVKPLFRILISGYAVDIVSPMRVGIPVQIYLMKQFLHLPVSTGTSAIVIKNFGEMFALLLISLMGMGWVFPHAIPPRGMTAAVGAILVLFTALWLTKENLFKLLVSRIQKVRGRTVQLLVILYLLKGLFWALGSNLVLSDFGMFFSPFRLFVIQSVSTTVGLLSFIPMGWGARDVTETTLLVGAAVPVSVAACLVMVERIFGTVIPLLLGWLSLQRFKREERGPESSNV